MSPSGLQCMAAVAVGYRKGLVSVTVHGGLLQLAMERPGQCGSAWRLLQLAIEKTSTVHGGCCSWL